MPARAPRHLTLLAPGLSDPLPCPDASAPSVFEQITESLELAGAELLLARGDRLDPPAGDEGGIESLLWRCFDVSRPAPGDWPAAAVTYLADGATPGERWILRADPVHLRPDLGKLVLFDASALGLTRTEADALAGGLNAHFESDGWAVEALHPARWYVALERAASMLTRSVAAVLGGPISDALPQGEDAPRWRTRMNEAQMVLHASPVNAAREERGQPAVNSVWFWGGGRVPDVPRGRWDGVWTDDVLAQGLARIAGAPCSPVSADARSWLGSAAAPGRYLVVLDAGIAPSRLGNVDGWRAFASEVNRSWLVPLLAAVGAGQLATLRLVPGAGVALQVTRSSLRRVWRRRKPWSRFLAECAARGGAEP